MTPKRYELVDNDLHGRHEAVLAELAERYDGPLSAAAAYVGLYGLDLLAALAAERGGARLLIGAAPESEALTGPPTAVGERFEQSVKALRRERDFSAFPAARRAVLERVSRFLESSRVEVRRYDERFLHGKAYILGADAALVTSANLTQRGLTTNLELGVVHYERRAVQQALEWYERRWAAARDFRAELLDLLRPPLAASDPQTIFLRALLELYGSDFDTDDPPPPDGRTLTAFQQDGLARAKRILDRYGGVLYADGVGMGKTEIGLQLIRECTQQLGRHVLVISPAQLRDRLWQQRLAAANLPGTVVSYQELAQDRQLARNSDKRVLPLDKDVYRLVVVDEAHAYRNTDNSWYAALERLMGGPPKQLLLLTATPVNNSLWDLHSLFLLFARHDGAFADEPLRIPSLRKFFAAAGASDVERLSETKLFPLIDALTVRRDRAFIQERYRSERFADGTQVRFPEPELREHRYDLDRAHPGLAAAVADGIDGLTMARYRPSAYRVDGQERVGAETALAGLLQSALLKRFESSWYAALETVRRMRSANETALRFLEEQGALPPAAVIRDAAGGGADAWLDSSRLEQLAAESEDWTAAEQFSERFPADLRQDIERLDAMIGRLEALQRRPDPKLHALREVLAAAPAQKIAVFTAFQDTAVYLRDQFERDPALLAGRSWTVVIGSETDANARTAELERFCPASVSGEPDFRPPRGEVDLLLSTDVLSEGQNLQQAQAVLSFDMPWNPQRVVQRNGRIIRLRSPHETVYLYTLLPQQGELDQLLQLEARLQAKILAANAAVGMETPVLAGVSSAQQIYADLHTLAAGLAGVDSSLLDEQGESSAFAGEQFRALLRRARSEGDLPRLRALPWGSGAAFVSRSAALAEPAVFFACRTRQDQRHWRIVSRSGEILHRDDLPILRLIDPQGQRGCAIPASVDMERLFAAAAEDICAAQNALREPAARSAPLPASQRWALDLLRSPNAPTGTEYDAADQALSVGRSHLVRRELSQLRREYSGGKISLADCARRIIESVERFGLRPVAPPAAPPPITPDDLGVVCYQVLLPA